MYKIGVFAQRINASIRTLRYYDSIGLLKPDNTDMFTGYRYYSDKQIKEYKEIMQLKKLGFSLEEIKLYLHSPSKDILKNKKKELEKQINLLEENIKVIDNMLEKKELKLKFIKADINDLIKKWGEDIKDSYLYRNIENGNCDYYLIYNGDEFYDDFWIYLNNGQETVNDLCINGMNTNLNSTFDDEDIMREIFEFLKPIYKSVSITLIDKKGLEEKHSKALKYGFKLLKEVEYFDYQDNPFKVKNYTKKLG